jgi:hypothetical protein
MNSEEDRVFDSEVPMKTVVQCAHYLPDEWREKLYSKTAHTQFGELFAMKAVAFATKLARVVLKPFILWSALPPYAPTYRRLFPRVYRPRRQTGVCLKLCCVRLLATGNVKVRHILSFIPPC